MIKLSKLRSLEDLGKKDGSKQRNLVLEQKAVIVVDEKVDFSIIEVQDFKLVGKQDLFLIVN